MKTLHRQSLTFPVAILATIMLVQGCTEEAPKAGSNDTAGDDQGEFIPTPDELAAIPGRYRIAINPINDGPRAHFLLDTATGQVWGGYIPKVENIVDQMRQVVTDWVPVEVKPAPDVVLPEPGRFSIESSYTYGSDKFLLDSVSGNVWVCVIDDKQNFVFLAQTVHRPIASSAAPTEGERKALEEKK